MPGHKIILSDVLSWRPDFVLEDNDYNDNMTMLPDDLFINLIDLDLQKWIANCGTLDKDATNSLAILLKQGPTAVKNQLDDWNMGEFDGKTILFYKGRNYIPQDDNLRRDIAKMFHDHETAGHPGEIEIFNSIKHHYWWPGLRTFVKKLCQRLWNTSTIYNWQTTIKAGIPPHWRSKNHMTFHLLLYELHNQLTNRERIQFNPGRGRPRP